MNTLRDRLTWARAQKSARDGAEFTQEDLAAKAGVSQGNIAHLESGRTQTSRKITEIAEALGVDVVWLSKGKGEPFSPKGPGSLSAGSYQEVETFHAGNEKVVLIPMVRLRLSAGVTGFHIDGETGVDTYPLDRGWVQSNKFSQERLIAVRVKGDSMEPRLYDGDIVVINTADTKPVDGEVYAINYEGEAVIKRMSRDAGSWWLTSDNPDQRKYHRKSVRGSECIIVGRVVKKESTNI